MKQKPPAGYLTWDDFYKARAANPQLFGDGTSMSPQYKTRFAEAVGENKLLNLLQPNFSEWMKGGKPSKLDVGLLGLDVALPAIPIAAVVGPVTKALKATVKKLKGETGADWIRRIYNTINPDKSA